MIFEDTLNKIRQKPREERNAFAFMTALSITSVVALFWIFSLITGFARGDRIAEDSRAFIIASPFEVIRDQFRTVIENNDTSF